MTWILYATVIFFLILLWKNEDFNKIGKIAGNVVALLFLIAMVL